MWESVMVIPFSCSETIMWLLWDVGFYWPCRSLSLILKFIEVVKGNHQWVSSMHDWVIKTTYQNCAFYWLGHSRNQTWNKMHIIWMCYKILKSSTSSYLNPFLGPHFFPIAIGTRGGHSIVKNRVQRNILDFYLHFSKIYHQNGSKMIIFLKE